MSSFEFYSPKQPDRTHMHTMSTLNQRFPVDLQQEAVNFSVTTALPHAIETGLSLQGCARTTTSLANGGGIQLFPAISQRRLIDIDRADAEPIRSAHEIFHALTERAPLSVAHFEVETDEYDITQFRIAVVNDLSPDAPVYELAGSTEIGPIGEHSEFFLTTHDPHSEDSHPYFQLDEELAAQFLDAILTQQREPVTPASRDIQSRLRQLVDGAPAYQVVSIGEYTLKEPSELTLSIAQRQTVTHGLARTVAFSIYLEEQAAAHIDGRPFDTSRGLLLEYDEAHTPAYYATITSSFSDPENIVPIYKRDKVFDTITDIYRSRQIEFFHTLGAAAARLSEI